MTSSIHVAFLRPHYVRTSIIKPPLNDVHIYVSRWTEPNDVATNGRGGIKIKKGSLLSRKAKVYHIFTFVISPIILMVMWKSVSLYEAAKAFKCWALTWWNLYNFFNLEFAGKPVFISSQNYLHHWAIELWNVNLAIQNNGFGLMKLSTSFRN